MKIGIQTQLLDEYGYGRWKEKAYLKLKEHGYTCLDFPMANTNTEIYTLPIEKATAALLEEKSLADSAGIEIVQTHGPWRWPPKDSTPDELSERMDKMKKAIYFTSVLKAKNCVIHPIMPYGINDKRIKSEEKTWDKNIEFFNELLDTAEKYDVTICIENMPLDNFSLAKPDDVFRFVKEINHKNLRICLDTGHAFVFENINLYDEVRKLKGYLCALHIHDNKCGQDLHLMPYFGNIDWKKFAEALRDIDYSGSFTLETMPPRKLPTPIFEQLCISLASTAKLISDKIT